MPATFADGTNLRYAAMPAATRNNLNTTGLTIAGWLRQSAFGDAGNGGQMVELVTSANALYLRLTCGLFGTSSIRFEVGCATTTYQQDFNSTPLKNHEWVHVVLVWNGSSVDGTNTICYINGAAHAATGGRAGVGAIPVPDGSIAVGGGIVNSNRDIVGMLHKVAVWNAQLNATEAAQLAGNGYRAYDPDEIRPTNLIVNCEFDGNTDNECDATTGTPGAKTGGTPTLTNRVPGDIPGVGFWFKAKAAGNTITSTRVATAIDYAGSALTAVETASSGPIQQSLGGSGDAYAASIWSIGKYLSNAASGGLPFNARAATILGFSASIGTPPFPSSAIPRVLMALGDPAGAGKAEVWLDTSGFPVGGEADAVTARTTGTTKRVDCANARLIGAVFRTTGVDAWADDAKTAGGTPCTAATGTGFRMFATCGSGTPIRNWDGHVYDVLFYQRALHDDEVIAVRAAFRDADATAGIGQSYFQDAVGVVSLVGSSSSYGYSSTYAAGLMRLAQPELADKIVYNFGRVSGTRDHISTLVSGSLLAADVLALFPKAKRHAIMQPFGNDYDGTGTNGYGGSVTYATVLASYQASVDALKAEYAKVAHWETGPRGSVGGGVVDDTNIQNREAARQSLISGLTGMYRLNFDSLPDLAPEDGTAGKIHAITTGLYYNADEIHLNDDGFTLLAGQFEMRLTGLFSADGLSIPLIVAAAVGARSR